MPGLTARTASSDARLMVNWMRPTTDCPTERSSPPVYYELGGDAWTEATWMSGVLPTAGRDLGVMRHDKCLVGQLRVPWARQCCFKPGFHSRNRLRCVRCVNENRKKRKRLRWQVANHCCHCFDRAFLLAGACVCFHATNASNYYDF